jgi:tRNA A37 N6-isopentenylltransferase MiaA
MSQIKRFTRRGLFLTECLKIPVFQVAQGTQYTTVNVVHFPELFTVVKVDSRTNSQNTWLTESHDIEWLDGQADHSHLYAKSVV